ncbi:MAG: endonuclease/exonuclease/phosphatase family protein [Sphingomonas sp.]
MKLLAKASMLIPALAGAMLFFPIGGKGAGTPSPAASAMMQPAPFDGSLSVLTYNVHGLPWPLASGRPAAFGRIATRLAALRAQGRAPQIVVMQEAFTDAAKRIGAAAGYRYIVQGPDSDVRGVGHDRASAAAFAAQARWTRGETEGPLLGSGLMILSDYPILATDAVVYPRDACAGFDCLANKGAVLARVAIPGFAAPVDIVTTHLNCRERSGTAVARADEAYRRQLATLAAFVRRAHDPRLPLILAGDFNVGRSAGRNAMVHGLIADLGARSAMAWMVATNAPLSSDALYSWHKNKDLQLTVASPSAGLAVEAIGTPFGHERDGGMLSDHVGYVASYRIGPLANEHPVRRT